MSSIQSIVTPKSPRASSCGYCGPPGGRSLTASSHKDGGLIAVRLSCDAYQKMIDRGWRRSGTYCYKPDLRRSCCPQYTIKLDALQFKPSRSHRKLVNRWNRFILEGNTSDKMDTDNSAKSRGGTGTSKKQPEFSLVSAIHASEYSFVKDTGEKPAHQFEVILEPSAYSEEKYALYEKYQKEIHLDDDNRPSGFKRFLVESPLHHELMPYPSTPPAHLPPTFGSYHQLYRVDGELIAMGVIDILPGCVSSVYFMYDKKWEQYSLGKLSAMRETALAKEINDAGVTGVDSLYMGFYIHSCQKMRYKGEYSPSYLLDPEDYTWYPLSNCIPLLEGKKYASFAHPEHSIRDGEQVPGRRVAPTVSDDDLRQVNVVAGVRGHQIVVVPMNESAAYNRAQTRVTLLENIDALGLALSKEMIWYITPVGFVDDDDDEQEEKEKEEVEAKLVR